MHMFLYWVLLGSTQSMALLSAKLELFAPLVNGSNLFSSNTGDVGTYCFSKPDSSCCYADSKKSDEAGVKGSLYGPPRITFPTDPPTPGTEMELDADLLPFAIDRDSSLPSPPHPSAQNEDLSIGALSEMDLNMTGNCSRI